MGGSRDPRTGTKHSTSDADYALRNYVWLLSDPYRVWLLDPRVPSFDKRHLVSEEDTEFWTVSEDSFGAPIGDLNFFPSVGVLCSPRGGFEPSLRLTRILADLGAEGERASPSYTALCDLIAKLSARRAETLREFITPGCSRRAAKRFPDWSLSILQRLLDERSVAVARAAEIRDEAQLQELLQLGVSHEDATKALALTAGPGGTSALRARNLLQTAFARYRVPAALAITEVDFGWERAHEAIQLAFHAEIALRALVQAGADGDLSSAVTTELEETERATRSRILEQQKARSEASQSQPATPVTPNT